MASHPKQYLTRNQTAKRYAVTERTISRWVEAPELGFPIPMIVNGRLFFDEAELVAWERSRARKVA